MPVSKRIAVIPEILLVISLCYFPLCYRMDTFVIRQWDEARNAVHAMEMLQNHNYIVRTYQGIPEQWETKPPMLIWLQTLSLKVFGTNELAVRLPVIISTFLTVLLLIFYFHRNGINRHIGYLASLVLITSQGYIDRHIARTGDHDALLILLLTAIILIFYRYISIEQPKSRHLFWIALLFAVGVLTKSVAALFILPGLLVATFVFKSGKKLFHDQWLYIGIAAFLIITGGYYGIRENMQPGYLKSVWQWELLPRYANSQDKFESATFWYYAINLFKSRFTYWIIVLLAAMVGLPFLTKGEPRRLGVYLTLHTLILFVLLSFGTKNLWYDGLLYPLFAMIIGLFLYEVILKPDRFRKPVRFLLLFLIFLFPYISIIIKVSRTTEYPWDLEYYSIGYVLRNQGALDQLPNPLKIIFEGYNAHLLFYVEAENYKKQKERLILGNFSSVKPGDAIMLSQEHLMDSVKGKFNYKILYSREPVKVIQINEP